MERVRGNFPLEFSSEKEELEFVSRRDKQNILKLASRGGLSEPRKPVKIEFKQPEEITITTEEETGEREEEKRNLEQRIQECRTQLINIQSRIKELEHNNQELQEQKNQLEEQKQNLSDNIQRLEDEKQEKERTIEELQRQIDELQRQQQKSKEEEGEREEEEGEREREINRELRECQEKLQQKEGDIELKNTVINLISDSIYKLQKFKFITNTEYDAIISNLSDNQKYKYSKIQKISELLRNIEGLFITDIEIESEKLILQVDMEKMKDYIILKLCSSLTEQFPFSEFSSEEKKVKLYYFMTKFASRTIILLYENIYYFIHQILQSKINLTEEPEELESLENQSEIEQEKQRDIFKSISSIELKWFSPGSSESSRIENTMEISKNFSIDDSVYEAYTYFVLNEISSKVFARSEFREEDKSRCYSFNDDLKNLIDECLNIMSNRYLNNDDEKIWAKLLLLYIIYDDDGKYQNYEIFDILNGILHTGNFTFEKKEEKFNLSTGEYVSRNQTYKLFLIIKKEKNNIIIKFHIQKNQKNIKELELENIKIMITIDDLNKIQKEENKIKASKLFLQKLIKIFQVQTQQSQRGQSRQSKKRRGGTVVRK